MGAVFGAMLNARGVFGPAAWAPVLNNVVVLAALGVYWLLPAPPSGISTAQLLVLGIGTTLGIVVQAAAIVPALRRTGFRWCWRWGWDRRLTAFGGLAAWVVGYVLISQVALAVTNRVASAADDAAIAIYANAWLLIQVPYGILGVSLLTVLMPRMSAAAADGRTDRVVADLSLGSRLSAVALLPISAVLTVFGPALGTALFSVGRSGGDGAALLGQTLAVSAFGLLPLAVVMLQLRVFYALADARTPTFVMVVMTVVKVPLLLAVPAVLPPERVVLGLAAVNAAGFVVGAVVGAVWLSVRLGRLDTVRVVRTSWRTGVASVAGAVLALLAMTGADRLLGIPPLGQAWLDLLAGSALALVLAVLGMRLLRVHELDDVLTRFR
ncbi:putative peptidoglycan lipid II flippase [Pseudonocardia sediminis]|uniref:Putative peptidoglycan lipid II flippase n=1 Tax=Pseudonocardia sediminis TaxID=1397368 RepID=A0A4Q7UUX7_PSEST|nr:putative peptidoglycan lipid II flippase [Pseudonocardia sediminis]